MRVRFHCPTSIRCAMVHSGRNASLSALSRILHEDVAVTYFRVSRWCDNNTLVQQQVQHVQTSSSITLESKSCSQYVVPWRKVVTAVSAGPILVRPGLIERSLTRPLAAFFESSSKLMMGFHRMMPSRIVILLCRSSPIAVHHERHSHSLSYSLLHECIENGQDIGETRGLFSMAWHSQHAHFPRLLSNLSDNHTLRHMLSVSHMKKSGVSLPPRRRSRSVPEGSDLRRPNKRFAFPGSFTTRC